MHRQSSFRNQRSKSVKVKYILQICLLLAVCFWLIYQVKHSHDKKKEFDESDAKISRHEEMSNGFGTLGRKELRPRVEETSIKNEKHDEVSEEEEATEEEVDENKNEEDEPEDKKVVENEDEETGGRDDEIDEHEKEKLDAEVDREEDNVDDEKEREEIDENETEEKDPEDGIGQKENEISVEHTDQDRDDRDIHEARDENYKADDASSEVTHNTQTGTSQNVTEHEENSNEHPENILERDNKENNGEEMNKGESTKELEVVGAEGIDDNQSNLTTAVTNVSMLDKSEDGSSLNNTETRSFGDRLETSNSSTEGETENHVLSLHNLTENESNSEDISNSSVINQAKDSSLDVDTKHFDSNSPGPAESKYADSKTEDFTNSTSALEQPGSEAFIKAGDFTESSEEDVDTVDISDKTDGTNEVLESEMIENPEEVQHDAIDFSDSSNPLEDKDVRTDLDTLPVIQTEGTNGEDAAAE